MVVALVALVALSCLKCVFPVMFSFRRRPSLTALWLPVGLYFCYQPGFLVGFAKCKEDNRVI